MKKMFIILTILVLNSVMLNSIESKLDSSTNFTLLSKKVNTSDEANSFATVKSDKSIIYNFNLTYGLAYNGGLLSFERVIGGSIGLGKIQQSNKSTKEITYNFHYFKNSYIYITGLYAQMNSYRNAQRTGFVTIFTTGLDYIEGKELLFCFNPGGPNSGDCDLIKINGFFPNIAIGCGYSIMLSVNSRMLIYLDLGIKRNISTLNMTISF